tara:strand:+ start:6405 stop:7496 length:1092 start_codon:yes stop_codon:yes gene_type:complete
MAVSLATIESEVAYFLGYGYNTSAPHSAGSFLENIAHRAVQQFVVPPALQGEQASHKWSWLSSTGTITLNDPETFSHTSAAGNKLNDDTGGEICPQVTAGVVNFGLETIANFPQWVFTHDGSGDGSAGADQVAAIVEISGLGAADGYHIPSSFSYQGTDKFRANLHDTSITVAEAGSGVSFTLYNAMVAGAANFGAVDGYMTHDFNSGYPNVQVINLGALRDLYAAKTITSGAPEYVAWDEALSRFLFYPLPDKAYTLRYRYTKDTNIAETSLDDLIPQKYEAIIINGALGLAENYADNTNNAKFQQIYESQIRTAIMEDRANFKVEYFGVNVDRSERIDSYGRKTDRSDIYYTNRSGTKFPS